MFVSLWKCNSLSLLKEKHKIIVEAIFPEAIRYHCHDLQPYQKYCNLSKELVHNNFVVVLFKKISTICNLCNAEYICRDGNGALLRCKGVLKLKESKMTRSNCMKDYNLFLHILKAVNPLFLQCHNIYSLDIYFKSTQLIFLCSLDIFIKILIF